MNHQSEAHPRSGIHRVLSHNFLLKLINILGTSGRSSPQAANVHAEFVADSLSADPDASDATPHDQTYGYC